ncbi:MAG: tetratricopeptide repeat protein [Bacteroidota bacterium]|nr:tetratricopeptide repeat protein [Bacteroidota bacterium]
MLSTYNITLDRKFFISLSIVLVFTTLVYFQSLHNQFTNWDDPVYILENPHIKQLTIESIWNIFTIPQYWKNYQPIVLISFAIDHFFHEYQPFWYHLTNLLIHLTNTALVCLFFYLLTTEALLAGIIALLFGIHPMHVESVAWVSARSDLIYALFYFSALIFYLFYLNQHRKLFYFLLLLSLVLSLLSKALAVSLPLVLFLVDYLRGRKFDKKLFIEKIPFFLIVFLGGMIAWFGRQPADGSIGDEQYPFIDRLILGSYSGGKYLWNLLAPFNLQVINDYPKISGNVFPSDVKFYLILFILVIIGLIYCYKRSREIFFGGMFFLLTILSVLPFFSFNLPVVADRYSYIPSVGIFYIGAVSFSHFRCRYEQYHPFIYRTFIVFVLLYLTWFLTLTWNRTKIWKDGITLWTEAIRTNLANPLAYNQRGVAYLTSGFYNEAMKDFSTALKIDPRYTDAYVCRGIVFLTYGNYTAALTDITNAIKIDSKNVIAYYNLGYTLLTVGRAEEALNAYSKAIELKTDYGEAYVRRGTVHLELRDTISACSDFRYAIEKLNFKPAKEAYLKVCEHTTSRYSIENPP